MFLRRLAFIAGGFHHLVPASAAAVPSLGGGFAHSTTERDSVVGAPAPKPRNWWSTPMAKIFHLAKSAEDHWTRPLAGHVMAGKAIRGARELWRGVPGSPVVLGNKAERRVVLDEPEKEAVDAVVDHVVEEPEKKHQVQGSRLDSSDQDDVSTEAPASPRSEGGTTSSSSEEQRSRSPSPVSERRPRPKRKPRERQKKPIEDALRRDLAAYRSAGLSLKTAIGKEGQLSKKLQSRNKNLQSLETEKAKLRCSYFSTPAAEVAGGGTTKSGGGGSSGGNKKAARRCQALEKSIPKAAADVGKLETEVSSASEVTGGLKMRVGNLLGKMLDTFNRSEVRAKLAATLRQVRQAAAQRENAMQLLEKLFKLQKRGPADKNSKNEGQDLLLLLGEEKMIRLLISKLEL